MKNEIENEIISLNTAFEGKDTEFVLKTMLNRFNTSITLASSLGAEDQVLTYLCSKINPNMDIFVLDTGRLNPETYEVMEESRKAYNINYRVFYPNQEKVEQLASTKGLFSFYESIENRKECCNIRKVEPLGRALSGKKAWITGLRKQQSITRTDLAIAQWDDTFNLIKFNPLANWSEDDIWTYIKEHNIPYNKLHDQGFPSIGCAPCTRAIKPGEDLRAGRWWWETPEQKECGLHVVDGKLVPKRNHS